jgi:hypothetical protein
MIPKMTSIRQMTPAVPPTMSAVCVPCLDDDEDGVLDIVEDGDAGKVATVSPGLIKSGPVPEMA